MRFGGGFFVAVGRSLQAERILGVCVGLRRLDHPGAWTGIVLRFAVRAAIHLAISIR